MLHSLVYPCPVVNFHIFPGQNEPRPGHGTPWINSGMIYGHPDK